MRSRHLLMMSNPPPYPHDITVMPTESGYVIGRVLPQESHGPWWEYLEQVEDLAVASARARELARTRGSRAWILDQHHSVIPIEAS